jgi:hypothetical protein
MKKLRNKQNLSSVPPVWWQNSKVSYSFFASGSSSFLDFKTKISKVDESQGIVPERSNSNSSKTKGPEIEIQTLDEVATIVKQNSKA